MLKKYKFCLDDVKMVKGNTNQERKINLKQQLIEFYQKHDPNKLGTEAFARLKSLGTRSHTSIEKQISPQMAEIDRDAEWGILNLEALERKLSSRYGVGLEDSATQRLRHRLVEFYNQNNGRKKPEAIEKIVEYASKRGLDALNEKLMLTYGKGINVDDLY